MTLDESFTDAQARVKAMSRAPGTDQLLELYALFKQGTVGDAQGERPGMFDLKGTAKYNAWLKKKGLVSDAAKEQYIALVDRLLGSRR